VVFVAVAAADPEVGTHYCTDETAVTVETLHLNYFHNFADAADDNSTSLALIATGCTKDTRTEVGADCTKTAEVVVVGVLDNHLFPDFAPVDNTDKTTCRVLKPKSTTSTNDHINFFPHPQ